MAVRKRGPVDPAARAEFEAEEQIWQRRKAEQEPEAGQPDMALAWDLVSAGRYGDLTEDVDPIVAGLAMAANAILTTAAGNRADETLTRLITNDLHIRPRLFRGRSPHEQPKQRVARGAA